MLVKFADIQIKRCSPATTGKCNINDDITASKKILDLDYDALFLPKAHVENRITQWAGKELVKGEFILTAETFDRHTQKHISGEKYEPVCLEEITRISPQFLYYYLHMKRNQILVYTKSGSRISKDKLSKIAVPVPSLPVQKNAINQLKKLVEKNEDLTNKLHKILAKLANETQQINLKLFRSLGYYLANGMQSPGDTRILRIKEAGLVQPGKTPNGSIKSYFGIEYPFYTQAAFEQGMNLTKAVKYLSERGMREGRLFAENAVIVCYIGAQFGKAGIARKTGACNSQLLSVTCSDIVLPEYLYYQVITDAFQSQMKNAANHSSIGKAEFENLFIEVPSLKKQHEIVLQLDKYYKTLNDQTRDIQLQLCKAEEALLGAFADLIN